MNQSIINLSKMGIRQFCNSSKGSRRILMLGAPGSGKGSFGRHIAPHFNIPNIIAGDLIRHEITENTAIGQAAKDLTAQGKLLDDTIMMKLIQREIDQVKTSDSDGFLLDGFPRRMAQAELFHNGNDLDIVLLLEINEDVLMEKTIMRRICGNCGENYNLANINYGGVVLKPLLPKREGICDKCDGELIQRADDKEEIVKDRLQVYHEETSPLISFYEEKGILSRFEVIRGMDDLPAVLSLMDEL